jgi:8-oxo-dGTP diphosphatase
MSRHARPARPVLGAAAVVLQEGRVLLIRRGQPPDAGEWSIPGGAVELGESVDEALRRELREETGLEIAVGAFLEAYERIERDAEGVRFHFVILDYAATVIGGTLTAGDDAAEAVFADLDDLDRYVPMADSVRRVITSARRSTPAGPAGR